MANWLSYYQAARHREPSQQIQNAVKLCDGRERALDLGCGKLTETQYLLEAGFQRVDCVDATAEVGRFVDGIADQRIHFQQCSFTSFSYEPQVYDLVHARYALPFNGKDGFMDMIKNISHSLKCGGVFVGQLFGVEDTWNTPETKMIFHSADEVRTVVLTDFEFLELKEEKGMGRSASGERKFWHVFHFIVRKV